MSPKIKLLINDDDFHMIDEDARDFLEWLNSSRDDGNDNNDNNNSNNNINNNKNNNKSRKIATTKTANNSDDDDDDDDKDTITLNLTPKSKSAKSKAKARSRPLNSSFSEGLEEELVLSSAGLNISMWIVV